MGKHRKGTISIGAYVSKTLYDYIDRLVENRGLINRSDAIRSIIEEHMAFSDRTDTGNKALTPSDDVARDIHHELLQTPSNADYEDNEPEYDLEQKLIELSKEISEFRDYLAEFVDEFST